VSAAAPRLAAIAPLALAIGGGLVYHIAAKSVPKGIDPALALVGAYTTALLASLAVFVLLPSAVASDVRPWHPSVIGIGIGAVMIEFGFVLAYRAAWPVSATSVIVNVSVALLLVPVGVAVYAERLSATRGIGIALCLVGVGLLRA
jgi:hypothetical protein